MEEFLSGGPSSSAAVRVVVVYDILEVEGDRQKEVRKMKVMKRQKTEIDGQVGEGHTTCA